MPEATSSAGETTLEVPNLPAGTLCATEVSYREPLKLTDPEKAALRDLCRRVNQRDMPARREQVVRTWERRLFDHGFQHLLPTYSGNSLVGFQIPAIGSGYGPGEYDNRSIFETNIYNAYSQIIISALTREVPTPRFRPVDRNNDADITAAEGAEKLKPEIELRNKMRSRMAEMARFLWTDGLAVFFTRYIKDGQRFGYEEPQLEEQEEETVPEDEEAIGEQEQATNEGEESSGAELMGDSESDGTNSSKVPEQSREPKGREVVEALGALEFKFPIKEDFLCDMPYAQLSREIDLQIARARYPEYADKIKAWQGGPGGDDIDRLARVNTRLGVLDNYVTTDSAAYDVTEQITWFRTAALLEIPTKEERDSLIAKAGENGLRTVFCGETFCECRALSMDEQLVLVHALPGDGVHRPGLGDWIMPIQKVLNNWLELSDEYFTRGVPHKWMDDEIFDLEKMKDQPNLVGATHPFSREPGVPMQECIFEETPVPFPQYLWEFIQFFQGELPQLLCGAFPALSGGGDSSPTDTYGGMLVQRDQAIGRIGLPWRNIKEAIACVFGQAAQALARNAEEETIQITGSEAVQVELSDLKGNFMAYAEVDENFPESWTQKQNRMALVVQDASTNPMFQQILDSPDNLETIKNMTGLQDLEIPMLEARDKQLGENVLLLKSGPLPNPALEQLRIQTLKLAPVLVQFQQYQSRGIVPPPEIMQQIQQIQQIKQQITTLPPQVSSVEIDEQCDNHDVEAATCLRVINSPRGRKMKNGDEEEQAGFQNLRLHYLEHVAAGQKQKANQPPAGAKPPSMSIAMKDLPPKEAAQLAQKAGIQANPQDFEAEEVAAAASKHPGPGGIQVQ